LKRQKDGQKGKSLKRLTIKVIIRHKMPPLTVTHGSALILMTETGSPHG